MRDSETETNAELLVAFREAVRERIRRDLQQEQRLGEALKEQTLEKLRAAITDARAQGRCRGVWLFGSFAWGHPTDESDIDLCVDRCPDPDALAAFVWARCERPAHVVPFERAPDALRRRALDEGVAL